MFNFSIDTFSGIDAYIGSATILLRNHTLTEIMLFVSHVGGPESLLLISCAIGLIFWLFNKRIHLIQFLLTMFVGAGAVITLKHLFMRVRPIDSIVVESGYSFPSGHALVAAVFFPVLIYIVKRYINQPWAKFSFVLSMLLAMLLVAASRIYLGVHYLSDVLGGLSVGIIISCVSILITESYIAKQTKTGK